MINKKIIIFGATGTIGHPLTQELINRGYLITVVSQNITNAKQVLPNVTQFKEWNYNQDEGELIETISDGYAIINLSGVSIASKRWNPKVLKLIEDSRILTTQKIVNVIKQVQGKPSILLNASSIGYYGFDKVTSELITEESSNEDDSWTLDKKWEYEAMNAKQFGVRVVTMRTSFVLERSSNGALSKLLLPFKLFVGGPIMPYKYYRPWIHIDDEVGLWVFALENENVKDGLNCTSPTPVTNIEFARIIGHVMHRPSFIPIPSFLLRIVVGKVFVILTQVKRMVPKKAIELGYKFKYVNLKEALDDIVKPV